MNAKILGVSFFWDLHQNREMAALPRSGWTQTLSNQVPDSVKNTAFLLGFGLTQVPLIFLVGPRVVFLSSEKVEIRLPLNRLTRNHLKSMYFGALCIGADVAGGLLAARLIRESGAAISLVFKDLRAEFLKRAEGGPVHFVCKDGLAIQDLVRRTLASGERESLTVQVEARVPKVSEDPVARFALTLSLKKSRQGKRFF